MIKNLHYFVNKARSFQFLNQNLSKMRCIYGFSNEKIKQAFNIKEAIQNRESLNSAQNILQIVEYDIKNNFYQYSYVKKQVQNLFKQNFFNSLNNKDNKQHEKTKEIFNKIMKKLCKYPIFEIDNQTLKLFYKLINQNMHTKSNQQLEYCLYFALITDKHVINSPIYIQFIRFYIKDFVQLIKTQLSINLSQQNISNTLKQFFFRIFQRGFLPRKPSYIRNLYINHHITCLNHLLYNQSTKSTSLMVRKVFYEYFILIKEFYENQMKENLYHEKNVKLMEKLTDLVNIMAEGFKDNIKIIQHQNKYLRELYIKLFLVIQNLEKKEFLVKTIYMYEIVKDYVKQEKQIDQEELSLLYQYINKVQKEFSQLKFDQIKNQISLLGLKQILKVLLATNKDNIKLSVQIQQQFLAQLTLRMSSITFKCYFIDIIQIAKIYFTSLNKQSSLNNFESLIKKFQNFQLYQQLQLSQISTISQQNFTKNNLKIKQSIIKSVLSKNIVMIGNKQLLNLLKIHKSTYLAPHLKLIKPNRNVDQIDLNQLFSNRTILLNFIFRFISDHHKTGLKFDSDFEQILKIIFIPNQQNQQFLINHDFNDLDNNYPLNIAQQMKQYLTKFRWRIKNQKLKEKISHFYQL